MSIPVFSPIYSNSFLFFNTVETIAGVAFIFLYSCSYLEEIFLELELNRIELKHISDSNESI